MTKGICLYLHVHQPLRVKPYSVFDIASDHSYFNGSGGKTDNRAVFEKVADKSYRPMNKLLETLLHDNQDFRLSLSITGTFIEQASAWAPDVLDSFRRLVDSGRVEIVGETYYHSLAFFYDQTEFERQVLKHAETIENVFGVRPTSFRNTELAYNNSLATWADNAGYKTILAEGWEPVLGWRSPNFVYRPSGADTIKLLMKNYHLSDDIAFRFGNRGWNEWPLTVDKYIEWLMASLHGDGQLVNLFMDYETFGEHQWADTGIFTFVKALIEAWLEREDTTFYTVSGATNAHDAVDEIDVPHTVTWADTDRDLTAWLGNPMQQEAMRHIYELERAVMHSDDPELIDDWRKLQTSDHAYYMCTKWFHDGDVHAYFSPYQSPYDAFLYYMNALRDIRFRLSTQNRIGGIHG